MTQRLFGVVVLLIVVSCSPADAAFNCGRFMCSLFGIANCKKPNLQLALTWASTFPRSVARPGAVVVQRRKGRAQGGGPGGHVSKIVEVRGQCRALVRDNRGTYERDICRSLVAYVQP